MPLEESESTNRPTDAVLEFILGKVSEVNIFPF